MRIKKNYQEKDTATKFSERKKNKQKVLQILSLQPASLFRIKMSLYSNKIHWNKNVLQFVCSTDLSHGDILELWRQWEYSEQLNLAERGFQQTVVRCYGFLRAIVVTGNASQLRNLKHKKVQTSKSELTTTPKLTAFVINAQLLLTNTCLLLTWKFPDFLSYFTRLFLSSCEAAEWIRSALRWMTKI